MLNIHSRSCSKGFTLAGGAVSTIVLSSPLQCSANPVSSFCEYVSSFCNSGCCRAICRFLFGERNDEFKDVRGKRKLYGSDNSTVGEEKVLRYKNNVYEEKSSIRNNIYNGETEYLKEDDDNSSNGEKDVIHENNIYHEENNVDSINNADDGDSCKGECESNEEDNTNNISGKILKIKNGASKYEDEVEKSEGDSGINTKVLKLQTSIQSERWCLFWDELKGMYLKGTGESDVCDGLYDWARERFISFQSGDAGDNFDEFCKQVKEDLKWALYESGGSKENLINKLNDNIVSLGFSSREE